MQEEQGSSAGWTQELNQETLITDVSGDYLDTFIELGNEFDTFNAVDQHNVPSGLDTPMSRLAFGQEDQLQAQALEMQRQGLMSNMDMSMATMSQQLGYAQLSSNAAAQSFHQYPPYSQISQSYQRQIPLTPISTEVQAHQYKMAMENAGQMIYDRQNASFTPLVSPAQTPLESAWNMPEYAMADEFFSPLTSPAIEAQQQQFTSTNLISSPVDLNREPNPSDRLGAMRKSRKKLNPTSRTSAPRSVRQAPASRPLNRRKTTADKPDDNSAAASAVQLHPSSTSVGVSSEDSVSPEPLSELLMRPPPVPSSRLPTTTSLQQAQNGNAPATPATLMKMPAKEPTNSKQSGPHEVLDDISLPAAMGDTSQKLPEINSKLGSDSPDGTPVSSVKTPKLSADSTPRSTSMRTTSGSTENLFKASRGGKLSKKRQSISSATISPALRPKISPSISPLVPSNGHGASILSAESSTLYLASKSNYQNILDGTHLPGVSYPETLAENLNSKRTSHKLAEQGRRNRINLALKEVESLLPPSIINATRKDKSGIKDEAGDSGDKPSISTGTSKANTVEMAIVYIKSLQAELKLTQSKLEAAEKLIAEGSSNGSQTSD